eukprot:scaffold61784_cov93-Phaeocystis_antarctica.AAC.1
MREAGREEHDLEDQSNKRACMSSASSAKAAHLAATPGFGDACVTFKLDSNESDMNLLRPKPPTPTYRTAADTAAAVAMEMVTVLTARMSKLEEQMKTTSFGSPAFASEGE